VVKGLHQTTPSPPADEAGGVARPSPSIDLIDPEIQHGTKRCMPKKRQSALLASSAAMTYTQNWLFMAAQSKKSAARSKRRTGGVTMWQHPNFLRDN
jgi:hypothetical protein